MIKIYLAGPMFDEADIVYNLRLAQTLRENGFDVELVGGTDDINAGQAIEIVAHWTFLLPQIASPCQNKSSISSTQ